MNKLYPSVPDTGGAVVNDQQFRLTRISELDAFLAKEIEDRQKLCKKYKRAVNIIYGVSTGVGLTGLGLVGAGVSLLTTGIGAIPGFVSVGLGMGAFGIDTVCGMLSRKCSAKAEKHAAIIQIARTKMNSTHQLVSKALIDGNISDEEFRLISNEVDRYQAMKEEIRFKARAADEAALKKQNEWKERGREEARAEFAKLMATLNVPQK